jgi:flagellar basal body rod protein FlgC
MNAAMSLAVSGMQAASTSFTTWASDLSNLQSDSPASAAGPQQPVSQAPGGASAPIALSQTVQPDGDPATAIVNQMAAALSYKANIAVFKTAQQMEKTLLDTVA